MKKLVKNERQFEEEKIIHFRKAMLLQCKESHKALKEVQRQMKEMQERMVYLT